MKIKTSYLKKGHRNRPGYIIKPKGLLFHTTNNWSDSAGDEMHASYMNTTTRVVSWHDTVDKDSCTLHIPHNENAWHAGDGGTGYYNRNWLGMEIACNSVKQGQPLDKATYDNAVKRARQICDEQGFGWDQLQPHSIVKGKNCPHHTLFDPDTFKRDVFNTDKKTPVVPTTVYTVKKGDTLGEIAKNHGATVAQLVKLNGISDPNKISIGQKIQLGTVEHVVKKGETLSGIASIYKVSTDFLVRLNGLKNPDLITVGQKIKLAGKAPAGKPNTPAVPPQQKVSGIPVRGTIKIVGVKNAAYIIDRPRVSGSKNLATISVGKKIAIAGSVPGWWEVIYQGRRGYVNEKFGRLL